MDERFSDQIASKLNRIDWQFRAAQAPEAWYRIWSLGSDHGLESDECMRNSDQLFYHSPAHSPLAILEAHLLEWRHPCQKAKHRRHRH